MGRGVEIIHVTDHCYFANSVRPRTEFLIGTVNFRHQPLALLPPPTLAVQSNSKSNMASQIKTLARPNKTPAVQARIYFVSTEMCTSTYQCLMEKLLI